MGDVVEKAMEEIIRMTKECRIKELGHRRASFKYRVLNNYLTVPAAVIAAVAGVGGISEFIPQIYLGFLSLIAATFSAVVSSIKPEQRAQAHIGQANHYDSIAERLRRFRSFEVNEELSAKYAKATLDAYGEEKD